MLWRRSLFRRMAVIGVGLMGGSCALAAKKRRLVDEVMGCSQRPQSLETAVRRGVVDATAADPKMAVRDADLVIVAVPVSAVEEVFKAIGPSLKKNAVVTDVCSVKVPVVDRAGLLPQPSQFVGSHPMAGSEKKGVEHARDDLFEGHPCIMTPTNETNKTACERLRRFWEGMGASVTFLAPPEHDRLIASVSHLPHLLAFALMDSLEEEALAFAGPGLKDTTRVAAADPDLWSDICLHNNEHIIRTMDAFCGRLGDIRRALMQKDARGLKQLLKNAQKKRIAMERQPS